MAHAARKQGDNARKGATGEYSPPADPRLDEIARILALGILRLRARQEENRPAVQDQKRDLGVDFSPDQSVHAGD